MKFLDKIENSIVWVLQHIVIGICRYAHILATVFVVLVIVGLSQCDGCNLSRNEMSQNEVETIVDAVNCAWSERHGACFCVYVNAGQVGMYAPDRVCKRSSK